MRISDWSSDVCSSDLGGFFDVTEGDQAGGLCGLQFGDDLGAGRCVGVDLAVYTLEGDVVRFEVGRGRVGGGAGEGGGDQQEGGEGFHDGFLTQLKVRRVDRKGVV